MNTYISLLRGINVGGHKKIKMAELRSLYESLGFSDVRSYLQSGNVVFTSAETDRSTMAHSIETAIADAYSFAVTLFVLDAADLKQTFIANPFLTGRSEDPAKLYVTFLADSPLPEALDNFVPPANTSDEFYIDGDRIYLFCPNGYGRTKLSNAFFERKLKVPATTRNWKTVSALYDMAINR